MSELFTPGIDSLVIYNFMFPRTYGGDRPGPARGRAGHSPLEEGRGPSCVALLDQLDGAALHAAQRVNFAVVAKTTTVERLLTWGEDRSWRHLRLLSSARNSYNRDYGGETEDGSQVPMLNVFHRDHETIRHFSGRGAHLHAERPRTGPPERRHPGAALEPVRPNPGRAP